MIYRIVTKGQYFALIMFQIGYLKNKCLPETKLYEYNVEDGPTDDVTSGLPNGHVATSPASGNNEDRTLDDSRAPLLRSGNCRSKSQL